MKPPICSVFAAAALALCLYQTATGAPPPANIADLAPATSAPEPEWNTAVEAAEANLRAGYEAACAIDDASADSRPAWCAGEWGSMTQEERTEAASGVVDRATDEAATATDKAAEAANAAYEAGITLNGWSPRSEAEAAQALSGGNYPVALRYYLREAEKGSARHQFTVAGFYEYGWGVPKDNVEALKWYRKAAEQGNSAYQNTLGLKYYYSQYVLQNYVEAAKWFHKSAQQGSAFGQYLLGNLYYEGRGTPQNYATAAKWFLKAAEQGDSSAQSALGQMYEKGLGVPQDLIQAHMWLNLETSSYSELENYQLRKAVQNRDRVAGKMTPAQIAEAQRLAREWVPKQVVAK